MSLRDLFTRKARSVSLDKVLKAMTRKDYEINHRGNYDLNVVGVRRTEIKVNEFNDLLFAFYPLNGQWQYNKFQITTLPGYFYLKHEFYHPKGTAFLVPGQYRDKYTLRNHNNQYPALCQKKDAGVYVNVWRDSSLDGVPNPDKTTLYQARDINIHRANPRDCTISVDSHSAGCQVFRCAAQFAAFMALVEQARTTWGNSFTYTLLDEADL